MHARRLQVAITALLLLATSGGCAYKQLRRNTVNQAMTIADIHQQQVLNNLAMFVYNPNSMPCFSYPAQGTNQVLNTTSLNYAQAFQYASAGPRAGQFVLNSLGITLNGQHQSNEAFTMVPVNDPRKLDLMRCAYQTAVANCGYGSPSTTCPDCKARLSQFYTGDVHGNISEHANGQVTSECLESDCWFHAGCEKCVPKSCDCIYVGHYCGVYVWVTPEGRDALAKLTLAILDFAMHDPPVRITKQVLYYIDEHGLPTTRNLAVGQVTAAIPVNERNESLLNMPDKEETALEQQLKSELTNLQQQLDDFIKQHRSPAEIEDLLNKRRQLEAKLEYLNTKASIKGLTNEFIPRDQTLLGPSSPGPIAPGLLQTQQLLQQVVPP